MSDFLFDLLGVRPGDGARVMDWHLQFQPVYGWATFFLLLAASTGIVVWSYRVSKLRITSRRRNILLGLRAAALATILVVLLRPALGLSIEGLVRQGLALLFDQSASMALRDPRTDPADQARAAIALGRRPAGGGLEVKPGAAVGDLRPSRLEGLRAALTNAELALIERLGRNFDLQSHGFAGDLLPLTPPTAGGSGTRTNAGPPQITGDGLASVLRAEGRESAPGTALRELLDRERGRRLGGVILFTDGIRNAGPDLGDTAAVAREAGVPVHVVALGTTAPRDLQLLEIEAPEVVFVRDEVSVRARIRNRGFAGQTVRASLAVEGTTVDTRDLAITADGDTTADLKFTPEVVGDFELRVEVPPRPDEILAENNRIVRRLRVIDDRIRVLVLEQSPRWEFRYLQTLLLRDRRVELKCLLFDGDPAISRHPGSPYIGSFPGRRDELFAYDLVIFGDVDPKNFTPSQLDLLAEFVSRSGGSLLMLAGRRFTPWSYRDTALDRLLPVEFDRGTPETAAASISERPVRLVLTPEGRNSPLLRLADDPAEHFRRWEKLPPIFWVAPVRRAKPAAQVLVTEVPASDREPGRPVIALQQYGVGQTMFIGTDNTWRWRKNEGEEFYVSFWGRVVQRLAVNHLLTGSRRTQMTLDRVTALPGEHIGVTARLFNSAFEPLIDPAVRARISGAAGFRIAPTNSAAPATNRTAVGTSPAKPDPGSEILLRAVPDQPGVYRGEIVAGAPGRYHLSLDDEVPAIVDFTVEDRLVEAGETALQIDLLRELAASTGGGFFREEDMLRLPDLVSSKAQRVQSRLAVDLWSSPFYYLLFLGFLTAEWILRKRWQLK